MNVDFKKLRYFVAVYEERSFSRAAAREHIAQPALSVHVRMLEDEFDVRLFERTPQGIIPTAAGHHLYKLGKDLLQGLKSAQQQMKDLGGNLSGQIRVGVMPSICWGALASILTRFAERHPAVRIRIVEAFSATLAEKAASGELDIAICNRPPAHIRLSQRLLFRDRLVLVSGQRRGLEQWRPYGLAELRDLKLVLPSPANSLRQTIDEVFKGRTLDVTQVIEIDGLSATLRLVETGEWSTLLPSCALVNEISSHKISINPLTDIEIHSEIYELMRDREQPPSAAQFLVQMIHDELVRTPELVVATQ